MNGVMRHINLKQLISVLGSEWLLDAD